MPRSIGAVCFLLVLGSSFAAFGQTTSQEPDSESPTARETAAEAHFEAGSDALAVGRTVEACPEFERSLELSPRQATARNLGLCYHLAGRFLEAMQVFTELMDNEYGEISDEYRDFARQYLIEERAALAQLHIVVDPASSALRVDGIPADHNDVVRVDPGRHVLTFSAEGFLPSERSITLGVGAVRQVNVELEPIPVEEILVQEDNTWLWVGSIGGAALALGAAAVVLAVVLSQDDPRQDPDGIHPRVFTLGAP